MFTCVCVVGFIGERCQHDISAFPSKYVFSNSAQVQDRNIDGIYSLVDRCAGSVCCAGSICYDDLCCSDEGSPTTCGDGAPIYLDARGRMLHRTFNPDGTPWYGGSGTGSWEVGPVCGPMYAGRNSRAGPPSLPDDNVAYHGWMEHTGRSSYNNGNGWQYTGLLVRPS